MLIARTWDVQVATTDVVNRLVIHQEGAVSILNRAVGRENSVVWLNDGGRHTRGRVHRKLELRLLSIIGGKTLEQQGTKSGAGTTAEGVENQESLQGVAVILCV